MKVEDEVKLLVHCKRILTYCGFLLKTRILHVFTFMLADVCGLKLCLTLSALCALKKIFFIRGNTEGTNSSKILFDVCVCFVFCKFVSGLIL